MFNSLTSFTESIISEVVNQTTHIVKPETEPSTRPEGKTREEEKKRDYATAAADEETRYRELAVSVSKLRAEVQHERNGEEWCRRAGKRSEEELKELRAKAADMEAQLEGLRSEASELETEMNGLSLDLQKNIAERDELRIQADALRDEMENLEMSRLKNLAEMDQLRFFERESMSMIDQLKMNNQLLQTNKEQDEIQFRKMKEQKDQMKEELKRLAEERDALKKKRDEAEKERDLAKSEAQKASFANDELHMELDNMKTGPGIGRFFGRKGNCSDSVDSNIRRASGSASAESSRSLANGN